MLTKYLSPRNDLAFKRIFGTEKNKEILIHFLNDLLMRDHPIQEVTFLRTVQEPEIASLRLSIVDVMCEDIHGDKFIIEMQVSHEKYFHKRALYYASKVYSSERREAVSYHDLKDLYFLAITGFKPFPNKKKWFSHIGLADLETNEHEIKSIQLFFLQLPLFTKTRDDLEGMTMREKWAYFFKYAEETTEKDLEKLASDDLIIKKAYQELDRFSWTQEELRTYDSMDMKRAADKAVKLTAYK